MKIDIKDLMDDYTDMVNINIPDAFGAKKGNSATGLTPQPHSKRPLLVAAALLLVVTAGVAAPFVLSRTAGHGAMTEGAASMESIQNELPSQPPTEVPAGFADSSLEPAQEIGEAPKALIAPHTITGAKVRDSYTTGGGDTYVQSLLDVNNIGCYGNMVNIDGTYYTLTDNGPELLETTHLQTTVELYGTWEVDIDYAVVDGELVFRDNSVDREEYVIVDGKAMDPWDYHFRQNALLREMHEANPGVEPVLPEDNVEWVIPNVAGAYPVEDSADTVMLTVTLNDKDNVDSCSYDFFYNIFTGEISDPLGNVPDLFDHGQFSSAYFNNAHTRAILLYFGYRQMPDGEVLRGDAINYICDLTTGEMTLLEDLVTPFLPEPEHPEGIILVGQELYWASDDTLIFTIGESFPNGKEMGFDEEKHVFIEDHDYLSRLYSYDMVTGTLNYQLRDFQIMGNLEGNNPYPYIYSEEDSCRQFFETATGKSYRMDVPMENYTGSSSGSREVYRTGDNNIYLADLDTKSWVRLSDYLELPDLSGDGYCYMKLLTEDWLCLMLGDTVYSYHIPDNLPMTPLTEK